MNPVQRVEVEESIRDKLVNVSNDYVCTLSTLNIGTDRPEQAV